MAEFYYGTGRRKTAVARVYLRPGEGKALVNGHDFHEYFRGLFRANTALLPLEVTGTQGRFDLDAKVKGGGPTGQIDAIKLGLARALLELNPDFRAELRKRGFLTRDSRMVERKKYGLHKARRAPQYSKR